MTKIRSISLILVALMMLSMLAACQPAGNVIPNVSDSDGTPAPVSEDLLPQVSPTFEWIRIAQRVPVRIKLDDVPPDIILRVGLSASVLIPLDDDRPVWSRLADYLR